MLALYHGLASTCSKKVRLCLAEKGLDWESHLLNLQKFEQHDPDYLRLNPNGVVPTLVHDGRPVIESSVIIEYIDDAFPGPPLRPADAYARAQMRLWIKWSDEIGYAAVYVPTWDRLSRPAARRLDDAALERVLARVPTADRRERWRATAREGFSEAEFAAAYDKMERTFRRIEAALADAPWLAGAEFSLADIAIVPFVERMRDLRPDLCAESAYPRLNDWLARMQARPSWQVGFHFGGMDASTGAVLRQIEASLAK